MDATAITIIGYGNVGKGVHSAILSNQGMRLVGIVSRDPDRTKRSLFAPIGSDVEVIAQSSSSGIDNLSDVTDVAILCGGSKEDLPIQGPHYARLFNTVDSFDTHANIPAYFDRMNKIATLNRRVAVISAGWDPGTFSLERVFGDSFLPSSKNYTFWGKGVSQGHSDALRRVPGVEDAIQYTVPIARALEQVRMGKNPHLTTREKHVRECYVALKQGADAEGVRQAIVTMPNYFADYNTNVNFVSLEEVKKMKKEMPHGGFVMTSGVTGNGNNAMIEYQNQWGSNPEATGNILVACARAAHRLVKDNRIGAFTMLDIPPAYYNPRTRDELLKDFM